MEANLLEYVDTAFLKSLGLLRRTSTEDFDKEIFFEAQFRDLIRSDSNVLWRINVKKTLAQVQKRPAGWINISKYSSCYRSSSEEQCPENKNYADRDEF